MALALLREPPLAPALELGPYRRSDYDDLPDEPRCELIYGRLYVSPSPLLLHQILAAELWRRLDAIANLTGGLAAIAPLDVHLADHSVVQPDVIYVTRERRSLLVERVEGAPDLLVEVLSPGTVRKDRGEKQRLYAEGGVREYWIADPIEKQIDFLVQRPGEEGRFSVALPEGSRYRSATLPRVELDLLDLWATVSRKLLGR